MVSMVERERDLREGGEVLDDATAEIGAACGSSSEARPITTASGPASWSRQSSDECARTHGIAPETATEFALFTSGGAFGCGA